MAVAKTILNKIDSKPLSDSLSKALRLSQKIHSKDFEKWCRLELGGYFDSNLAMDENVIVPEYRTVVGQHYDYYGRPLILKEDLSFVNETRLRYGVLQLENLFNARDTVVMHDSHTCSLIKQHLNVEVHIFRFSSSNLLKILTSIKIQLSDWLMSISDVAGKDNGCLDEDIIELKPNIYGIGIDLKALCRKWKGLFKKE